MHHNDVYAARYTYLTTRTTNKLEPTQAQTVIAAALLRRLHAVITTRQAWDPARAARGTPGFRRWPPRPPPASDATRQTRGGASPQRL